MEEEIKLIKKLGYFIAELRNCFVSIDAVLKLLERGKYSSDESIELVKYQLRKADKVLDELRVMGF